MKRKKKATKFIVCEEKQYTLQYEHKDYTHEEKAITIQTNFPSWQSVRLFPPLRKSPNASAACKLGGFRMDGRGKHLDARYTVCGLCGLEINYENTPSNLWQHLKNRHAEEFFNAARDMAVKEEEIKSLSDDMENIAPDMMMKLRENKWHASKYLQIPIDGAA